MKEIKKTAEKLAEGIIDSIKQNMESYGQGSSNLANSLRFEADEESIKIYAADYFDYAEKGRGPGGVPRNFESILDDWIKRHKVSFDGEKSKFINSVKWSIVRYGTKMWREGKERDFLKDTVEKNIEKFEEDISKSLIEEIKKVTE